MSRESIQTYVFGGFRVDTHARRLDDADGKRVDLSPRAFDVLLYLIEHRGEDVSKERLINAAWPGHIGIRQAEGNLLALGEVARFVVVDLVCHHLIEASIPGNAQAEGLSGVAIVEARAAQAHQLRRHGVQQGELHDRLLVAIQRGRDSGLISPTHGRTPAVWARLGKGDAALNGSFWSCHAGTSGRPSIPRRARRKRCC